MLKIAIVDDEQYICDEISEFILTYSVSHDREIKTSCFNTCEELIKELDETRFDIVFLDIRFSEECMSGIELGRKYLKLYANDNTAIIYVTAFEKYAIDAVKTKAFDFIKKPVTYENIEQALDSYFESINDPNAYFQFIRKNTVNSIRVSNIVYLESKGRMVYIHTLFNQYELNAKLSDLTENECFKNFIRIHKSYYVNINFVEKFTSDAITLVGRDSIILPISKSKRNEVKERLLGK